MITSDGNFAGGSHNGAPGPGESQTVILGLGNTLLDAGDLAAAFMGLYDNSDEPWVIARFQAVAPMACWRIKSSALVRSRHLPPSPHRPGPCFWVRR